MSGRLILLVGPSAGEVGGAVRRLLPTALHVDATALHDLVGAAPDERRLLRSEAALLVGGLYAGAGYDALVSDDVADEDVAAVVNRAAELADDVRLVRLAPGDVAEQVVRRLPEARVEGH